jgi:hypothetical protein
MMHSQQNIKRSAVSLAKIKVVYAGALLASLSGRMEANSYVVIQWDMRSK